MGSDITSKPIRLVIADDHIVVREGLASLLEDAPDLTVIGQASNGLEAISLVESLVPDVILLDISMPDMNGLVAAQAIHQKWPLVKILILTMHEEKAFFFEALRAGAAGYVLKGARSDRLITAIRSVHLGGVYLAPEVAGNLVEEFISQTPQEMEEVILTPREQEILALIARGLTNAEIAEQLTLSINTVKTHRLHIYQKLELTNQVELITYALQHGLFKGN